MQVQIQATKTYATQENAVKAVTKAGVDDLRFFMMTDAAGRFFPVFIGEVAVQRGVHFKFNVVG